MGHDVIFVETAGRVQSAGSLHSYIFDHALGAFLGHCVHGVGKAHSQV